MVLAETCQLVLFDPTLLSCAKKRRVEPPGRSCFLRWRVNTQGSADPCAIPVVLVKQCLPCRALLRFLPALSFWIAIANRFAAHSTIRLPGSKPAVFRRRKAFLLCKNPCAESGFTSLSYPRLESAQKYVTTPDWENLCTGQPRGARGTAVPLFREESRGTPSKGFLWATSS